MRKSLTAVAMLFIFATHAFSVPQTNSRVQSDSKREEYDVYSALLNERYIQSPGKVIVIVSRTRGNPKMNIEPDRDDLKGRLSPVSQMTIDDYKARNKTNRLLKELFQLNGKYTLISEKEWEGFFKEDVISGWEDFYKKYPDSIGSISLSGVGFNAERTQALVFFMHGCGATCGEGTYALLTKTESGWKVETTATAFVS